MADYVDFTRTHFGHAKMFCNLFEERLFTDAIIATTSQPDLLIHCHRVILAAVSTPLKNKFMQAPDPRETVFVGNMEYNILYDILKLIYYGQVRVRSNEKEDFMAAIRMLYIKLGDKIDKMVYHDQASSSSANSFPFLRGVVQIAPKIEQESVPDVQGSGFQPSMQLSNPTQQNSPFQPNNPFQQSSAIKQSNALQQNTSFQQSNAIQQGNAAQQNRQQNYPSRISPRLASEPMAAPRGPFSSSASSNFPSRAEEVMMPSRNFQASTLGRGAPRGNLNPSGSSLQISINPTSGEREILAAKGTATKRPAFPGNQDNSSWLKRPRDASPQAGPHGMFWLRLQHQVQTTLHAIWDKYGTYNLQFAGGSYFVGEDLFMAFSTKQDAQEALDVVGSAEPDTLIKAEEFVPKIILQELSSKQGNGQQRQSNLGFEVARDNSRGFGEAMNMPRANASMKPAPLMSNIFNRGAAQNNFQSTQQRPIANVFNRSSVPPGKGSNVVGRLILKNFPPQYKMGDYIRLLKTSYIKNYVAQNIRVSPGACTIEFLDAKELQEAKCHLDGKVVLGCTVSAAVAK